MREFLELGPVPCDEQCQQLGTPEYDAINARQECKKFVTLLLKKFGQPPGDIIYTIKGNPHDFGMYFEVNIGFNPDSQEEVDFAYMVENNLPATWDDDGPVEKNILRKRVLERDGK